MTPKYDDECQSQFLKRLLDIAPLLKLAEKVQDYYVGIGNNAVLPPCQLLGL